MCALVQHDRRLPGPEGPLDRAPLPTRAEPTWFGPEDRPLFGWVHRPADGTARAGVVLCPPLARERTAAHATFRRLADGLAAAGFVAIRFDYDGVGDSAGSDEDPDRVEAWTASVADAGALARSFGVASLALVGMRMGALLAANACGRIGDVESVVLWDPCTSGRGFLREQRAMQVIRVPVQRAEGAEIPGYEVSAETVAACARLELPDLGRLGPGVLVLVRPDRPAKLGAAAAGSHVEIGEAVGQDRLLDVEALHNEVPEAALARIVGWLDTRMEVARVPVSAELRASAHWRTGSATVTERVVTLGPAGLFGIETTGEPERGLPPVLMLNSGNEWHAGPNRLWVDLARRWAALGFRCVRIDESGLGDSPARPGRPMDVVRAPEAFDDVADAAAALSPADPGNVVLVGLCSGAYQALEHGLREPVRGICAINPVLHFRPPELESGPLDPRRRICRPTTAAVGLFRSLPLGAARRHVRAAMWRVLGSLQRRRPSATWPDALGAQGGSVLLVGGEDELRPVRELLGAGTARHVRVGDGLEIEVVPGLDHDLMVAAQRHWACDRLTEHLVATFVAPEPSGRHDAAAFGPDDPPAPPGWARAAPDSGPASLPLQRLRHDC